MNVIGDNKAVAEIVGANGSSMSLISSNYSSLHAYRLNKPNHKRVAINPDDTYASITFVRVSNAGRNFITAVLICHKPVVV